MGLGNKIPKVAIVSGYFNPLHEGHLDFIEAAHELSDSVAVIVNNDKQVKMKGSKVLYDEQTRLRIISALKKVDYAIVSIDKDSSVANSIKKIVNDLSYSKEYGSVDFLFVNSGDRVGETNPKESKVCQKLDIMQIGIHMPKVNSSSSIKEKI